jgi:Short C-terminal domain
MSGGAASATAPAPLSRRRRIAIWTLIVVASLIAVVGVLTLWVKRQMLDNEAWSNASAELIQDPEIRSALSVYLVNELYDNVDIAGELEQRLPPNLSALAGPISGALREPTTNGVDFLLARPRVQQLWINASTVAHEKLVNVLKNETGFGITTGSGVVTLDLRELVRELGIELGLSQSVLDRLPPDTGVITVMRSDQLGAAQKGVRAIEVLSAWVLVLVLALYAVAIYLAAGRRRAVLRNVGWAFLIVGLLTLIARRGVGNYAIGALTTPENEDEGRRAWLIASEILGQIGWAAVLYGVVAILGTVLAGPGEAATAIRRRLAPTLVQRPGVIWASTGALYLLLVLWGPTHALRTWWGVLLLGGLAALGVWAFRRETLREYPDGFPAREPRTGPRFAALSRSGGASAEPAGRSVADELVRLQELRDAGVISSDEFDRAKALALA